MQQPDTAMTSRHHRDSTMQQAMPICPTAKQMKYCPQQTTESMVLVDQADLSMPEGEEAVLPVLRLVGTKQDAHCGRLRPVAFPLCPLMRLS